LTWHFFLSNEMFIKIGGWAWGAGWCGKPLPLGWGGVIAGHGRIAWVSESSRILLEMSLVLALCLFPGSALYGPPRRAPWRMGANWALPAETQQGGEDSRVFCIGMGAAPVLSTLTLTVLPNPADLSKDDALLL
jgi:hypothetical protein